MASWGTSIPSYLIIDIMRYLALTQSLIEIPQIMVNLNSVFGILHVIG